MTAVSDGRADVAAIDAVAWALFLELEPKHSQNLQVFAWSRETPALPYITSPDHAGQAGLILKALQKAAQQTREDEIGLPKRVLPAGDQDYQPIRDIAETVHGMRLAPDTPMLGHLFTTA